jgi:hypothetical protein
VSFLDEIRNKGKSALRPKSNEAARPEKRAPPPRPLTMKDELMARLTRRNNAISGKSDKDAQRRDSRILKASDLEDVSVSPSPSRPSPPPKPTLPPRVNLDSEDEGDDDDDDADAGARAAPATRASITDRMALDDDDSSASSTSDLSDDSFDRDDTSHAGFLGTHAQGRVAASAPAPTKAVVSPPAPAAPPAPAPAPAGGGLTDASNEKVAHMLSAAKQKNEVDSDGDDWDP